MKALYFEEHGGIEVIRYGDVPGPSLGPGEVLLRVRACAINHLDIWVRRGWPDLRLEMPHWAAPMLRAKLSNWERTLLVVWKWKVEKKGVKSLFDQKS